MDTKFFRCKQSRVLLPQEIIEEILLPKLPVKSLLRFRCVSRSWLSLVDSKSFIDKHLHNSKRKRRAIFNNCFHGIDERWPVIHDPTNNHLKTADSSIVGCFNGVLCILKKGRIFLWNPATRISIKLPNLNFHNRLAVNDLNFYNRFDVDDDGTCGFGLDEQSGACKVFACWYNRHNRLICKVYSTDTNSWKKVAARRPSRLSIYEGLGVGVFACGKIHWIPGGDEYILYLDLKSEMFGTIELPSEPEARVGRWLRERDGCLYVIYKNSKGGGGRDDELLDVWVMGEYGVKKESWIKISTIPIPFDCGFPPDSEADDEDIAITYQRYFYAQSLVSLVGP